MGVVTFSMKGFDAKFLEELKSKNDIVDIIGRTVHLQQRGLNYWGRCPFHHEKTASFAVNSAGQFYHCFGCHKSGDVISFVMEIESLDFYDAVKYLAERVHMPLPTVQIDDEKIKQAKKYKDRLLSLIRDAAKYYYSVFRSGLVPKHVEYAGHRGLTTETLQKFGIGASIGYNELVDYLKNIMYQ